MKTLEATTQLGGFNQHIPMQQYNKRLRYSGPHWNEDYDIYTLFSLVIAHDENKPVEIIICTKKLITNIYEIGSKSGLNISKVLQDCFQECVIPINIWSDNVQGEFMGSVCKLFHTYGVGSKQSDDHKQNQNPAEHRIQEMKGTNKPYDPSTITCQSVVTNNSPRDPRLCPRYKVQLGAPE